MSSILLVEGKNDHLLIQALLRFQNRDADQDIVITPLEGIGNAQERIVTAVSFSPEKLGIVVDADGNAGKKFIEMQKACANAGLAIPTAPRIFTATIPSCSIFIVEPHMMEDVIWDSLDTSDLDPIRQCVDSLMDCLEAHNLKPAASYLPKAKLEIFFRIKQKDLWLEHALTKPWFPLDHPVYDDLKAFLAQL